MTTEQIIKWMDAGSKLFNHPMAKLLVPLVGELLPELGISEEQLAQLKSHYTELSEREQEAIRRSRG